MPTRILLVRTVLQVVVQMEIEHVDQLLAELHTTATVPEWIERWRPHEHAHHIRYDQHHTTGHTGFRRQSHLERKLTTEVVHPTRVHQ
uniref:Putative secreted protein n=1 Tax=Anopheles marajoara TaxID=58244 RepID=A0A2M4CAJ9_9DIPT